MAIISDFQENPRARILVELMLAEQIDNGPEDWLLLEDNTGYVLLEDGYTAIEIEAAGFGP